jgi:hypothetical protein
MKKLFFLYLIVFLLIAAGLCGKNNAAEPKKEEPLFNSSLHYTARGMAYWYDKANGGLETITGIPYQDLDCKNCHVTSCDACHKTTVDNKPAYSRTIARNQDTCLRCHKRLATIFQIDKNNNQQNVHAVKGMECMECHTAREMHGDGIEYKSMRQPDARDVHCGKCHQTAKPSISHKVHRDKLDCNACHVRHVVSCTNCHIETSIKEGKRVSIPVSGWVFLINYNGKVTSGNMQTFVAPGSKTFLIFAPQNSHSVMKEGRKCDDCHGTEIVRKVREGRLSLTWLEDGTVRNAKGVIPVVNGVTYEAVYQNYKEGKWIPIENPPSPKMQYAAFGEPLSSEQLKKLSMPMGQK